MGVIDGKTPTFNVDKVEGFGILDHEVCSVKAYPHQSKEYIEIWENMGNTSSHQSPRSLPKRLANPDLSPDTKVKRCRKTNVFFTSKIYTWTPISNVCWLMREVWRILQRDQGCTACTQEYQLDE